MSNFSVHLWSHGLQQWCYYNGYETIDEAVQSADSFYVEGATILSTPAHVTRLSNGECIYENAETLRYKAELEARDKKMREKYARP